MAIQYARRGDDHVAFAVEGDGPLDVVLVSNWLMDVESVLEIPFNREALERMSGYARVVRFDQPGTGHSDPIFGEMPSVETFADTIEVVMDAAGLERAALVAWDLAAPTSLMFAATRPDRVSALITIDGTARWLEDDGYPGLPVTEVEAYVERVVELWGKPEYATLLAPSMIADAEACEALGKWLRHALSPGMVRRVFQLALHVDVRPLLPSVRCPALVMAARGALAGPPFAQTEYLARHLPQARLAPFDSSDHLPYQSEHRRWAMDTVQEFLTGRRPDPLLDNRVLATVLLTDLVASTETAARMGDERWRRELDDIEQATAIELNRYSGRLIKQTGDGILAIFDGPARALRCAGAIRDAIQRRSGLQLRAGVHTGEIEMRGNDIGGIAVHICARLMALARSGEVTASSTVKDLVVGSGITFTDKGEHQLKGVPGAWLVYTVND